MEEMCASRCVPRPPAKRFSSEGVRALARSWARANRLLSPLFSQFDLERALCECLKADQNVTESCCYLSQDGLEEEAKISVGDERVGGSENVLSELQAELTSRAFSTCSDDSIRDFGLLQGLSAQKLAILPAELYKDNIWARLVLPRIEDALRERFLEYAEAHAFSFTFVHSESEDKSNPRSRDMLEQSGTRFHGMGLKSFVECVRSVGLTRCRAGSIALHFGRSVTSVRFSKGRASANLCFPEFVEALLRCACEDVDDSSGNVDEKLAVRAVDHLLAGLNVHKLLAINVERQNNGTQRQSQHMNRKSPRPLTPRRWPSDLSTWPHIEPRGLEKLAMLLDEARHCSIFFSNSDRVDTLFHCLSEEENAFERQDIFLQQKLVPALTFCIHTLVTSGDRVTAMKLLPFLLKACESAPSISVTAIGTESARYHGPANRDTFRDWIVTNVIHMEHVSLQVKSKFVLSLATHGGFGPRALDTLLALPYLTATVSIPLLLALAQGQLGVTLGSESKYFLIAGVGLLARQLGNQESQCELQVVNDLEQLMKTGLIDPRTCAWALRFVGHAGVQRLLAIARGSPNYSALARAHACRALALANLCSPNEKKTTRVTVSTRKRAVSYCEPELTFFKDGRPYDMVGGDAGDEILQSRDVQLEMRISVDFTLCAEMVHKAIVMAPAKRDLAPSMEAQQLDSHFPEAALLLVQVMQSDPETGVQVAAACALGQLLPNCVSDQFFFQERLLHSSLLKTCFHEHFEVRAAAVEALGRLASRLEHTIQDKSSTTPHTRLAFALADKIVAAATQLLEFDSMWKVRYEAVVALGRFGVLAATRSSREIARAMSRGAVRHRVAGDALASMGPLGHRNLIRLIESPGSPSQVRVACALGLGQINPLYASPTIDDVIRVLFSCSASNEPQAAVRAAALKALGSLARKAKGQISALSVRSLHPRLYHALSDQNQACANAAARVLGEALPEGELLLLKAMATTDQLAPSQTRTGMRLAAAHGLAIVGSKSIRTLLKCCSDCSLQVRIEAHKAIESIGQERIIAYLNTQPQSVQNAVVATIKQQLQAYVESADCDVLHHIIDSTNFEH